MCGQMRATAMRVRARNASQRQRTLTPLHARVRGRVKVMGSLNIAATIFGQYMRASSTHGPPSSSKSKLEWKRC